MSQENTFSSQFDNDSKSIGFIFMKAYAAWHNQIKNCLKKQSITHPQFIVLATLAYLSKHADEVTQVMISKKTNIDVMTISQIIENLEKKSFIVRSVSLKDSRAKAIQLTQIGYDKTNKTVPLVENIDKQFFSNLGSETNSFHQMLLKLIDNNALK